MTLFARHIRAVLLVLSLGLVSTHAMANEDFERKGLTILDTLSNTEGAEAVVAAVLLVDDAGSLNFSLAGLLDDPKAEVILLAPGNAAFEKLLGLDTGFLNDLSVEEIQAALPSLLPMGVGPEEVAAILLKHAALPKSAKLVKASENALLRDGEIAVADRSVFPVGIGGSGVVINDESTIIKANIPARNGVIHFIDSVIVDGLL
jgi:hypothetical protein